MDRQLLRAAEEGDLPTVQWILQQPGGVNGDIGVALQFAVKRGHVAIVQALLQVEGVNVNVNLNFVLHLAVGSGHVAIVQALLQVEGVNVNARLASNATPLHSVRSNALVAQALLEAGADPNAADDSGNTPLFYALLHENVDVIETMLNRGADPEVRNAENDTAIHFGCQNCRYGGGFEVIQTVIRHCGPNSGCLTAKNEDGETPLDCLRYCNLHQEELVRAHRFILQTYSQPLVQRHGPLCVHSVLRDAVFTGGNDGKFQLPVGKLSTEQLQILLEHLIVAEPGSLRTLDGEGLLPLQVASQLNFPGLVINVLLRPYPGALLQL